MRPLHYVEYPPGPTATDVALTYSCFTVRELPSPDFVHRVWPDGCVSLTFGGQVAQCTRSDDVVRFLDEFVCSRLPTTNHDDVVRAAVGAIVQADGKQSIATIARDVGTSPRTLQRRFGRVVGLTPKEFASIRRGREALKRVVFGAGPEVEGWSSVAMDAGFADQAHMSREFARLTRFAPRALQSRLDTIDHGRIVD